eukprot:m.272798 g.272798  ORF g.272798 m.272798 type:complete len:442 (+) comp16112_c0_seq3:356-1681(+)
MGDTDTPSTLPPALLAKLKKRGIVKSEPALVPEPDLPPNWRVVVEKGTDSKYYWNTVTGATVWDRPTHPNDDPTAGPSDTEAPSSDGPQPPASNVSSSAAAAAAAAAEGGSVIGPTLMKRAYEALVLNEIPDDVEEGEPPAQVPPTTAALPHVDVLSGPQDFGPAVSTVAADAPIRYETCWKCGKKNQVLPDGICMKCARVVNKKMGNAPPPQPPQAVGFAHMAPPPMLMGMPAARQQVPDSKRPRLEQHPRPPPPLHHQRQGPPPPQHHQRPPPPQHGGPEPRRPPRHIPSHGFPPHGPPPPHHAMPPHGPRPGVAPHHHHRPPPPQQQHFGGHPPRGPPHFARPPRPQYGHMPPPPPHHPHQPPPHCPRPPGPQHAFRPPPPRAAPHAPPGGFRPPRQHRPPRSQNEHVEADPMDPSAYSDTPVGVWGNGLDQASNTRL